MTDNLIGPLTATEWAQFRLQTDQGVSRFITHDRSSQPLPTYVIETTADIRSIDDAFAEVGLYGVGVVRNATDPRTRILAFDHITAVDVFHALTNAGLKMIPKWRPGVEDTVARELLRLVSDHRGDTTTTYDTLDDATRRAWWHAAVKALETAADHIINAGGPAEWTGPRQ